MRKQEYKSRKKVHRNKKTPSKHEDSQVKKLRELIMKSKSGRLTASAEVVNGDEVRIT